MATQIQLNQISFDTLPSFAIENSQVWNQTININKGEQVLVSAPSGKGKSSFISLLYGLRRDYTGYYKIDGVDTAQFSAARWSDFRSFEASIVFQDLRLLMDYSVWDNLALKGKLTGSEFDKNSVYTMAEVLGIDFLLEKKCSQLSYGERQRVAIIRSLLQKPDFFIMDEPFSHLDEKNSEKALQLIQNEAIKIGSGLIMTTLGSNYGWGFDRLIML